jgi:hypothetical protein
MTAQMSSPRDLSDRDLLNHIALAVEAERRATAHLIALLVELDARRLYLGEGFSSLFTYCTQALHFAEHAAFNRIEAARAARRFPIILDLLAEGAITLASIRLLAPHLTAENHSQVLHLARHKSKRDVERLVATLSPRPDVPSTIRKLPTESICKTASAVQQESVLLDPQPSFDAPPRIPVSQTTQAKPLAPERYKIQFTVSRETYEQLRRAQDLLRHSVPNGDPAIIFERALASLLAELERSRIGKAEHPRKAREPRKESRHIPAAVKRLVWQRDNGRCAFNGAHGQCTETGFLEYHHVVPFAAGGETSASNLELRCRAHNQYEAELWFGVTEQRVVRVVREARAMYRL